MLHFLTLPGRKLARRPDGVLAVIVSLIVYVIILVVIALLIWQLPGRGTSPASTPMAAEQATNTAALTDLPTGAPPPPPLIGPNGFVPLQSQAVKDAIHRALVSGATQRWQDGTLTGYAVPSLTTDTNGCRAIRYTIDQSPNAGFGSINACDASRR